jgi:hypothetical protein
MSIRVTTSGLDTEIGDKQKVYRSLKLSGTPSRVSANTLNVSMLHMKYLSLSKVHRSIKISYNETLKGEIQKVYTTYNKPRE